MRPFLAILAAAILLPISQPAKADPAVGAGVSFVFGGGFAFGVKLFSDDQEDEFALSLGLEYVFNDGVARPNIGLHYLFDGAYLGGDAGVALNSSTIDFGLNIGIINTSN